MKTYGVGGAVRDRLLGLPPGDRDHVVVGATVDEMLAAGFKPVGRDFPVFLHPATHEEYALARTERKVAPGYAGFVFHADRDVTLAEDLGRRDLTINAMAEDDATHAVIDPFDGQGDLARRVLRHVGPAFVEDPVRILRLARFAARFADFRMAPDTLALMRAMVADGEVDALVPERVWQELSRGLMEATPSRMLAVLSECGALARLLPELAAPSTASDAFAAWSGAVDRAAAAGLPLDARYAVFASPMDAAALDAVGDRLAVPRAARDLAALLVAERAMSIDAPDGVVELFARTDALRRPDRFDTLLAARSALHDPSGAGTHLHAVLRTALAAARSLDAGAIARAAGPETSHIADALRRARVAAVAEVLRPT